MIEGISRDEAIERTMQKVIKLYQKTSIPTIAHSSIKRKIKRLLQLKRKKEQASLIDKRSGKVKDQGKHSKKKKNNKFKEKLQDNIDKIFEVSSEIPDLERNFYLDQCDTRKMFIGTVDVVETKRMEEQALKIKKK